MKSYSIHLSRFVIQSVCILIALSFFPFGVLADDEGLQELLSNEAIEPQLTLLYTATSRGELYPCPTCGKTALGGLARRSHFIEGILKANPERSVLFINGPDEILSDNDIFLFTSKGLEAPDSNFKRKKASLLLKAHSLLSPDIGYLSSAETKWLKATTGHIPLQYIPVSDTPVTKVFDTRAGKVGVVLFPKGIKKFGFPSESQKQAVLNAGKKLINQVNLIIGVSPWGSTAEERFIPEADGVFSVLLGGGPGLGFPFSSEFSTKSLLWVRSENQGRAVNLLSIMEIPPVGVKANWLEDVSFSAQEIFLKSSIPSSQKMVKLIGEKSKY